MSDDYAPFPARELEELAIYHDESAVTIAVLVPELAETHLVSAAICRNAVLSYNALQERFGLLKLRVETGVTEDVG